MRSQKKNAVTGGQDLQRRLKGNHCNMITDYRVYHPERDLSNGGFCNG